MESRRKCETGVNGSSKPSNWVLGTSGTLEKQQALITAEPILQPSLGIFIYFVCRSVYMCVPVFMHHATNMEDI